jgi:hypothetical protein
VDVWKGKDDAGRISEKYWRGKKGEGRKIIIIINNFF